MKWSFSELFLFSKQMHMYVVWFWYSMALFGMYYGTYKRKRKLFFGSCWKTTKEKFIVNHSPSAAG